MRTKKLDGGAYGVVSCNNDTATKIYRREDLRNKLENCLIQEYVALKFMEKSPYIVNVKGLDIEKDKIHMEKYDCDMQRWIINNPRNIDGITHIFEHVLLGLIHLHDMGLVHADIKPSNVLVKLNPLSAALGDCGFVSRAQYSRVRFTTRQYRESKYKPDTKHDIYAIGIFILKVFCHAKLDYLPPKSTYSYETVYDYIERYGKEFKPLLLNLTQRKRKNRMTAREIYEYFFSQEIPKFYFRTDLNLEINLSPQIQSMIEYKIHLFQKKYNLNRTKRGCYALYLFLSNNHKNNLSKHEYNDYCIATILILNSMFSEYEFTFDIALKYTESPNFIFMIEELVNDKIFVSYILKSKTI